MEVLVVAAVHVGVILLAMLVGFLMLGRERFRLKDAAVETRAPDEMSPAEVSALVEEFTIWKEYSGDRRCVQRAYGLCRIGCRGFSSSTGFVSGTSWPAWRSIASIWGERSPLWRPFRVQPEQRLHYCSQPWPLRQM